LHKLSCKTDFDITTALLLEFFFDSKGYHVKNIRLRCRFVFPNLDSWHRKTYTVYVWGKKKSVKNLVGENFSRPSQKTLELDLLDI